MTVTTVRTRLNSRKRLVITCLNKKTRKETNATRDQKMHKTHQPQTEKGLEQLVVQKDKEIREAEARDT